MIGIDHSISIHLISGKIFLLPNERRRVVDWKRRYLTEI
jgi:hypothetical protein